MKNSFPLLGIFSLTSLVVVAILMALMSWLLGDQLEEALLERDKVLTVAMVQAEIFEYLGDKPFDQLYLDKEILNDVIHAAMVIPGSYAMEMINPAGKIVWSLIPKDTTIIKKNPEFLQALNGTPMIYKEDDDYLVFPDEDVRYSSALYIPIFKADKVEGVVELHRNSIRLKSQVESLKLYVRVFCAVFGLLLYGILIFIIYPASKILNRQHDQLRQSAKDLEQKNIQLQSIQSQLLKNERLSAIGEVSAAVAHGLKNPLASLRAAMQLTALPSLSTEERDELSSEMLYETDRLTARLNHLLNFVRPFDPDFKSISLLNVIKSAVHSLQWQIDDRQLKIKLPENVVFPEIEADPHLLEEVVLIVLSNAIDASSADDEITFILETSAHPSNSYQTIAISDQGEGVPLENRQRIFDQFFTTRSKGTGLGLAICKKIVDLHEGKIKFEFPKSQGTTVKLSFPVQREKLQIKID